MRNQRYCVRSSVSNSRKDSAKAEMFAGIAPLAIPQFPLGITYNAARICNLREPVLGSSLVGNIFRNVYFYWRQFTSK